MKTKELTLNKRTKETLTHLICFAKSRASTVAIINSRDLAKRLNAITLSQKYSTTMVTVRLKEVLKDNPTFKAISQKENTSKGNTSKLVFWVLDIPHLAELGLTTHIHPSQDPMLDMLIAYAKKQTPTEAYHVDSSGLSETFSHLFKSQHSAHTIGRHLTKLLNTTEHLKPYISRTTSGKRVTWVLNTHKLAQLTTTQLTTELRQTTLPLTAEETNPIAKQTTEPVTVGDKTSKPATEVETPDYTIVTQYVIISNNKPVNTPFTTEAEAQLWIEAKHLSLQVGLPIEDMLKVVRAQRNPRV